MQIAVDFFVALPDCSSHELDLVCWKEIETGFPLKFVIFFSSNNCTSIILGNGESIREPGASLISNVRRTSLQVIAK
jgi:hypothetical protein